VTPKVGKECIVASGFCNVPAGCFVMGAARAEKCRPSGSPSESQHPVAISTPFQISQSEVTNYNYTDVTKKVPSGASTTGCTGPKTCPVNNITWDEAAYYCNKLSDGANLKACYNCVTSAGSHKCEPALGYGSNMVKCPGFRLPTEGEWEYAYRAGAHTSTTAGDISFCTSSDGNAGKVAWYSQNATQKLHDVMTKKTGENSWGLFDMAGNVSEWTHSEVVNDLGYKRTGVISGLSKTTTGYANMVLRGGHYLSTPKDIRAASRATKSSQLRAIQTGFRCVRSLPDQLIAGNTAANINVKQMTTDSDGNRYLVGSFSGKMELGWKSITTTPLTDIDAFVVKLDPTGNAVWLYRIGAANSIQTATAVSVDSQGNVAVGGSFYGTVQVNTVPATTLSGSSSYGGLFVVFLDDNGIFEWAESATRSSFGEILSVEADYKPRRVYVTGYFSGSLTINGVTRTAVGQNDIFLASLNLTTGAWDLYRMFGGKEHDAAKGIVSDQTGKLFLTGYFKKEIKFGTTPKLTATAGTSSTVYPSDVFVVGLTDKLAPLWAVKAGGNAGDGGNTITLDGKGNLVVGGYYAGANFKWGSTTVKHSGNKDGFVAMYTNAGTFKWVKTFSSTGWDEISGLAVGPLAKYFMAGGWFGNTMVLTPRTIKPVGKTDVFMARLIPDATSSTAKVDWVTTGGGSGEDFTAGVGLDSKGRVHVGGSFTDKASFHGRSASAGTGKKNAFVWMRTLP